MDHQIASKTNPIRYTASGQLMGVPFKTCTDGDHYWIRFEASARAAALVFVMGANARSIEPSMDSGKAWYQIECSNETLDVFKASLDGISDIIFNLPTFGQIKLFDDEGN